MSRASHPLQQSARPLQPPTVNHFFAMHRHSPWSSLRYMTLEVASSTGRTALRITSTVESSSAFPACIPNLIRARGSGDAPEHSCTARRRHRE